MADGYLEKHREEYEARKEAWLRQKRHLPDGRGQSPKRPIKRKTREIERPEDEAL